MTTTHTPTHSPVRQWLLVAAVALIAAVGGVLALTNDGDDGAIPGGDALNPGGSTLSCVEVYNLETLASRDVAFAGTVRSIDGDQVSFEVDQWFRGGDGPSTTLTSSAVGGITSAGGTTLAVGDRLLVAGDGGFAWDCGFTQPYDDAVASQWADVFAG